MLLVDSTCQFQILVVICDLAFPPKPVQAPLPNQYDMLRRRREGKTTSQSQPNGNADHKVSQVY